MALGILSSKRTLSGLVAVAADCWDAPGFKACHTKAWEQARTDCRPSHMDPLTLRKTYDNPNAAAFYRNNPDGTEAKCIEYLDPILTVEQCSTLCPKTKPKPPVTTPTTEPPSAEPPRVGPSAKVVAIGAIALFGLYVFMKEN